MKARAQSKALALLLGLGAIDLAALNAWVLPSLLLPAAAAGARDGEQTAVMAASERDPTPPPRASQRAQPPVAATAPIEAPAPSVAGREQLEPGEQLEGEQTAQRASAPTAVLPDRGTTVRFMKGTWWIGPADRDELVRVATMAGAGARFAVDGYADESGPDELNRRISRARADAIAELLVRAGIDRARIALRAHGELPVVKGDGRDERRAELRVLPEVGR